LGFDGIDDYVRVPQSPTLVSLQQMTLAYWVKYYKPTSGPDNVSTTIANGPDAAPELGFFSYAMHDRIRHHLGRWSDTTIAFADVPFDATIPLNQQNYVFVAFVVTDTKVLSYRNGYKQQENNRNGKPISRPSQDWYFAYSGAASWPYYLNGHLDEVRIYNRALSPSEIDELYRQGFPGTLATPRPTSPERSATVELPRNIDVVICRERDTL